jgi:hypothetical protein
MQKLDLSIIIVSFNTRGLLKNCIASIYKTTDNLNYEIIVVDNASEDGSPEMVERDFNQVLLLRNSENLGFARATNQAMQHAKGGYVLLLNSDTLLQDGTVETLITFIDTHPKAAAVGPKVLDEKGTLQNKGFFFPSMLFSLLIVLGMNKFLPEKAKQRLFPRFYWDENETREVDYLEGSCFLMRKEAIESIGLLPEDYFMYFEEEEWCYRAKKNHYEIWYVPTAEIIHYRASSPLDRKGDIFDESRILFYKRNIGVFKGVIITTLIMLATLIDMCCVRVKLSKGAKPDTLKQQLQQHRNLLKRLLNFG